MTDTILDNVLLSCKKHKSGEMEVFKNYLKANHSSSTQLTSEETQVRIDGTTRELPLDLAMSLLLNANGHVGIIFRGQ